MKILSIDGGGIKGLWTASFLATIEERLNERNRDSRKYISDYFDLIVGTSTGGIIALALANRMEAHRADFRLHKNTQTFIPSGLTLTVLFTEAYVHYDRDDISFTETARAVNTRLKDSKVIDKPIKGTPESEDLGSSRYISDTQWDKFYNELSNLISHCDEALDEESQEKAAKIWRKLFGDRFPIYKDSDDKSRKGEAFIAGSIIGRNHTSVLSLTVLCTIFFRHSRVNGNPVALVLDSCFRRNDNLSKAIYGTAH